MTGDNNSLAVLISGGLRWEEKSLLHTAERAGIEMRHVHVNDLALGPCVSLPPGTVVLVRTPGYFQSIEVAEALEGMQCVVRNPRWAISVFGRKSATDLWLNKHRLPYIRSRIVFSPDAFDEVELALGYPLVLKPIIGGFGRGIHRIDSRRELMMAWDHLSTHAPAHHRCLYLQRIIDVAHDLRVLVLNRHIISTIERRNTGEFAKNIARGGCGIPYALGKHETAVLDELSPHLPSGLFGVDLLVDVTVLDCKEMGELMNQQDEIFSF